MYTNLSPIPYKVNDTTKKLKQAEELNQHCGSGLSCLPYFTAEGNLITAKSGIELKKRTKKQEDAKRDIIKKFTNKSKNRLLKAFARQGNIYNGLIVTLTYREIINNGKITKRHLDNFRKRLERRWGKLLIVWKREFQRRGAEHYHMLVSGLDSSSRILFRKWVARAWFECCEGKCGINAGTSCETIRSKSISRYFTEFCGVKLYQNVAPEGFKNLGRWWGVWNQTSEKLPQIQIKLEQYFQIRRILRKISRTKKLGYISCFGIAENANIVYNQLIKHIGGSTTCMQLLKA